MSASSNTRQRILETAVRIVDTRGARHLTLDAVAADAGLSKGGVLYHFPSKRALLEGMLALLMTNFEGTFSLLREAPGSGTLPAIGLMILAEQDLQPRHQSMGLAILAAAAEDPSLLDPARQVIGDRFAQVRADTEDGDLATVILLAVEGLRFLDMLRLLPAPPSTREKLFARLLDMARNLPARTP